MSIYIHIGLHKTASTFLQREIFQQVTDENFNFINLTLGAGYNLIKKICFQDEIYFNVEDARLKFSEQIIDDKINLISHEGLSGDPMNGGIPRSAMVQKLKKCFPDGKIILFIRRQDGYSLSNYKGSIRRGSTLSIKEYFDPAISEELAWQRRYPNATLESYKYFKYIELILELFGQENVLVIPYEEFNNNKKDTLNKLCDFIGINCPEYKDIRRNLSWGRYRIAFNRKINIFMKKTQNPYGFWKGLPFYNFKKRKVSFITYNRLINHFNIQDYLCYIDRPYVDTNSYSKRLLELCAEDNQLLDEKFNLSLKKYGYY